MKHFNIVTQRNFTQRLPWIIILLASLALIVTACAPVSSAASSADYPAVNTPAATSALPAATAAPAATTSAANSSAAVTAAGPKAYIGLFKDNAVAVLDTATNRELTTIPIPAGPHGLVITPDGRTVYASSDGDSKVSVIDTAKDKVVKTIEVGQMPHGLAITPDGRQVLVAVFGASQVAFIDTGSNQVVGQVPVPNPHNIAISPDGHLAYVASQKPSSFGLAVLNVADKTQTTNIVLDTAPRALNFSPDGKLLYFTQAGVDAVQVLDPASNKVMAQIPVGASPHHPLFTPDGQLGLVVSQGPGELDILNPAMNNVNKTVKVGKMPHWIALNAKGDTAWVTNEGSNDVSVVDLGTGAVKATIPVGNAPRKIVIQPAPAAADKPDFKTTIKGFAFAPTITVTADEPIVWTNDDSVPHTVTSDDKVWDSGDVTPGRTYRLVLDKPGTYHYHCMHHPYMTGTIVVTA